MYNLDQTYDAHFFYTNVMVCASQALYITPHLIDIFKITKVLDIGCASGLYLKAFRMNGIDGIGVEGSTIHDRMKMVDPNYIVQKDLRFDIPKYSNVDFVMSIEVAEHIEKEYADVYVNNLTKHGAQHILLTAAPPGQSGAAHVNCQPKEYWVEKIEKNGYTNTSGYDERIDKVVSTAGAENATIHHWFSDSYMVFKKV